MKNLLYILIVSFCTSLALVSCTEEEVTPKADNGGGNISTGQL